jgi:hypothetical protein
MLDAGRPFSLWAPPPHADSTPCRHGVVVEPLLDASAGELAREVALRLRSADRLGETKVRAYDDRCVVVVSLATGRCEARDDAAARFLAEANWFADAIASSLDVLRERAARAVAQRDRSTCKRALEARTDDLMIPYHELFPADWDPVVMADGTAYHVVDQHCPNPACPCTEIVLGLYRLERDTARHVGDLRVDRREARPRAKATTPAASALFEIVWSEYGNELVRRHDEARAVVRTMAHGAATRATPPVARATANAAPETTAAIGGRPSRNAPCPCGSGKKFKKCCALGARGR